MLGEARALVHTGCLYHNEKPEGVQTGLLTCAYVRCVEAHLRAESDESHRHFLQPLLSPTELETVMASQRECCCCWGCALVLCPYRMTFAVQTGLIV